MGGYERELDEAAEQYARRASIEIVKDEDGQVEWRDNSAVAYCRADGCDWDTRGDLDIRGLRPTRMAAQLHTAESGHQTKVESTEHWIDEYGVQA